MIKFIYEFPATEGVSEMKLEMTLHHDSTLTDLLPAFEQFLKGAGYAFDGELQIFDEEGN